MNTKQAQVSQYTEMAEYCNSYTSGNKIFKDGQHVGWRTKYWELGVNDTFEARKELTESDVDNLRKKYPWIFGYDVEGVWSVGCDSYDRFSMLLDILSGSEPLNAAIS